jgi:hypothetical protein
MEFLDLAGWLETWRHEGKVETGNELDGIGYPLATGAVPLSRPPLGLTASPCWDVLLLLLLHSPPQQSIMKKHLGDDHDEDQSTPLELRVGIMVLIFCVSLFGMCLSISISLANVLHPLAAASFPTITRRVRSLSIPPIVFFVLKHFGTGLIVIASSHLRVLIHPSCQA